MRKIQTVMLALLAVLMLNMMSANSAFAETTLPAEWLANGKPIAAPLENETTGEILLEDNKTSLGAVAVLCSAILDGAVGSGSSGEITKMLNLAGEEIGVKLVGLALEGCVTEHLCNSPLVWPVNLPWRTELFLMVNGEVLNLVEGFGYEIECTIGIKVTDECTASDTELPVLNDPVTGDAEASGGVTLEPLATCSLGGTNSGVNETDELAKITLNNGELLTVSSEGEAEPPPSAEWLANGKPIAAPLENETTGEILLEDNKTSLGSLSILCSAIMDGTVGLGDNGEITKILNLAGEELGVKLVGLALEGCATENLCNSPLVYPVNLPWTTELFLMENGEILDLVNNSGYELECTVGGVKVANECISTDTELPVLNDPVTGDAETPGGTVLEPLAACSLGGANAGVYETDELATISLTNGELLTVSSE